MSVRRSYDLHRRIANCETFIKNDFVDIALQFHAVDTGSASPVFGGRWSKLGKRYLESDELDAQLAVHHVNVSQLQLDFILDDHNVTMFVGGRRGGKSQGLAKKAVYQAVIHPLERGQCCSPTNAKSRIMWRYIAATMPSQWVAHASRSRDNISLTLHNGYVLQFISLHKPDSAIGEGVTDINLDESQSISQDAYDLMYPALSDGGKRFRFSQTATLRRGPFQTRYELLEKLQEQGISKIFRARSDKNPFVDTGKGSALELAKLMMSPARYRREIEAEWDELGGIIYYLFNRTKHHRDFADIGKHDGPVDVTAQYLKGLYGIAHEHLIGVDYGWHSHHAVILKIVEWRGQVIVWAVDEVQFYNRAQTADMAEALIERGYGGSMIVDDTQGQIAGAPEVFNQFGFTVRHKTRNPMRAKRIEAVLALMREYASGPRFWIDTTRCSTLTKHLEQQAYKEDSEGRVRPEQKERSHLCDAMGYPIDFVFPSRDIEFEKLERKSKYVLSTDLKQSVQTLSY